MVDWITVVIELVGIVILLTWIVIPIREFRGILRAVRHRRHTATGSAADTTGGRAR